MYTSRLLHHAEHSKFPPVLSRATDIFFMPYSSQQDVVNVLIFNKEMSLSAPELPFLGDSPSATDGGRITR